jgi:hypothetical protein
MWLAPSSVHSLWPNAVPDFLDIQCSCPHENKKILLRLHSKTACAGQARVLAEQVEEMDILSGCVGWQLEAARSLPGNAVFGGQLCLRLGPLFRLQLLLPTPGSAPKEAQARLELVSPGAPSCLPCCKSSDCSASLPGPGAVFCTHPCSASCN